MVSVYVLNMHIDSSLWEDERDEETAHILVTLCKYKSQQYHKLCFMRELYSSSNFFFSFNFSRTASIKYEAKGNRKRNGVRKMIIELYFLHVKYIY